MLKRKIEKKLIAWKNTENRKPLIIKGCRQCGKTFSVLDFAKKNYKNVVYLNFFENPDWQAVNGNQRKLSGSRYDCYDALGLTW